MKQMISYTTLTVLTVDLLATAGDITMTWTSPMYSKLYSNDTSINPLPRPISKEEDAYIASLINIGAMVGGIPFSYIADRFGRKIGLLTIGLCHIIAYVTMAFAGDVNLFLFGRIFGGLAVGGGYTLLPMYIAEISEEHNRGFYSTTLTIFWAVGNFLPYLIGPFLNVDVFNLINAAVPLAFFILFLIIGTETPFYLVGENKIEDAERVLMALRTEDQMGIQKELKYIRGTLEQETSSSLKDIFANRGIRKAFIISLSLTALQQLAGWNAITFYLQPIFEPYDSILPSHMSSLVIGACIFGFSLPVPYLTNKYGRKTLLIFSSTLMSISLVALGIFFSVEDRSDANIITIGWVPIASIVVLVFGFQTGLAGLPWTITSEIFPKNVKKLSASLASASCWIASFLMTQFFNDMINILGRDGTFFFYAAFALICALFTLIYVPETKGRTFKQIQEILQK